MPNRRLTGWGGHIPGFLAAPWMTEVCSPRSAILGLGSNWLQGPNGLTTPSMSPFLPTSLLFLPTVTFQINHFSSPRFYLGGNPSQERVGPKPSPWPCLALAPSACQYLLNNLPAGKTTITWLAGLLIPVV